MKTAIHCLRRVAFASVAGIVLAVGTFSASVAIATFPARAQVAGEFQSALEPYGSWQPHPRFGGVWVPYDLPPNWRPYTYGRWVYTEEWGWYWVSDEEEADWGWVTFHYGRWAHDRRLGWFWVPGDEWAPAWVDWRRGDDYVGWAPLPPDEIVYEYGNDPAYWVFLPPRYLVVPRIRTYFLPQQRTVVVFRRTVIVNRTVRLEHRDRRGRFAVNPGIAPGIVAAAARRPVQTFHVQPRVLASTEGVAGAVQVRPQDLQRSGPRHPRGQPRPSVPSPLQTMVQPTQTVVQPIARVPQAQPLRNDEQGRLGPTPPRAAQGATVAPSPGAKPALAPQPQTTPTPTTSPPATAPSVTTPSPQRRDVSPPAQQPTIVRPIPPQATPPASPQAQPQLRGSPPPSGEPPLQRPTIVRPIPPQAAPASPAPSQPQQQLRGPPPPQPQHQVQPPSTQRQGQPPPQQQRQMQPPPQQRPPQAAPHPPAQQQQQKRPAPKPGEKPPEPPK